MLSREEKKEARSIKVANNFTLYEMIRSANHPDVVVYPSDEILADIKAFAENTLQKIRNELGAIKISSGYRNPELNKAVGGVHNSIHQYRLGGVELGQAADIVPLKVNLVDAFNWIGENYKELGLKIAIIYRRDVLKHKGFIHIDNGLRRQNFQMLEKWAPGNYRFYKG